MKLRWSRSPRCSARYWYQATLAMLLLALTAGCRGEGPPTSGAAPSSPAKLETVEIGGEGEFGLAPPAVEAAVEVAAIEDEPMRIGGAVKPPKLVKKVEPVYADHFKRFLGTSDFELVVDASGRVKSVRVVRAGRPAFDAASVEAIEQWVYEPATLDGKPVSVYLPVTVTIDIRG